MPAKNLYHDAVRVALIADGWTITADPLRITVGQRKLFVDLAADEDTIGAERAGQRIAVEVQSFLSESDIDDLHHAVGQFVVYRIFLNRAEPGRKLYLAVPEGVYDGIMSETIGQLLMAEVPLHLLVFDPIEKRVVRWTS
ncbi:MAG: XisH family protein [Gemmataceae bacterium]|nr:XisH family protein [Gemmataceae bacterium]